MTGPLTGRLVQHLHVAPSPQVCLAAGAIHFCEFLTRAESRPLTAQLAAQMGLSFRGGKVHQIVEILTCGEANRGTKGIQDRN